MKPRIRPLTVTFDTNALEGIVAPKGCREGERAAYAAVREAIRAGQIAGFFGEAVVALDALSGRDKPDIVGRTRIVSESRSTGPRSISISVGPRWCRPPIHPQFTAWLEQALELGMRAMIGPRRFGDGLVVRGFGDTFYVHHGSTADLIACGEKAQEVDKALMARGVGRARALRLGLQFSTRDGRTGELWLQGLGRARNWAERKKAWAAINEWADGEAIASHVGHGNDLFCTLDYGKSAGSQSALHPVNRDWLRQTFGVEFATPSDLATLLAQPRSH
jgi:hypothetical protein